MKKLLALLLTVVLLMGALSSLFTGMAVNISSSVDVTDDDDDRDDDEDEDEDETEYSLDSSKAFASYMEKKGRDCEYAGITGSGSEYFLVTVDEDTQPVKIYVVFDTDNKGAVMYAFSIAEIPSAKLEEAIEKCDEANADYRWAKWTLDTDDNTITAQGDVIFRDDNVGEITWHMCKALADIVDDYRSNFDEMAE